MSPSTSNTPPQSNEGAGSDLAPTHAATTVVDSTSKQVGAALSDNNAIIEEFRTGSKIDHPTGWIEDIANLKVLRDSLIGYSTLMVSYNSSQVQLRRAVDTTDSYLSGLVEERLQSNPTWDVHRIIQALLQNFQDSFLAFKRDKESQELAIVKRIWAVAWWEWRDDNWKNYTRNGKIDFRDDESVAILHQYFPGLVVYIEE